MADHPTRRATLKGLAAASLLHKTVKGQSGDSSLCFTSAIEMARLIRTGKLSAREALAAHLKQIERVNPKVNAIVTLVAEMAANDAAKADEMQARKEKLGPLHGLPVAHKDLMETRGIRTTFGSPLYKDYIPTEDDLPVARIRRAGAIILGKTNTPEFGSGSQTFNTVFGKTRNPYDLTKTCGGSSGGAAVALACGLAPVATGSDTGGSLRNPAAFCNVVGFRPSIGRVPNPKTPLAWLTLSTSGCLGRSVADLAFVLSTLAGPDPRSPLSINEPGEVFARPLDRSFKGVRVAWFKDLGGAPFDSRVRVVLDRHRATFESLGCIVEEAEPDFAPAEISFRILRAWNTATTYGARLHDHPDAFKDTLKGEIEEGLRLTGTDLARAETAHSQLWRRFQAFLERFEYFVLPTTQLPAFDVETPYPKELAGVKFASYIDWMKSCWYISATGNPAASVPGGFTPEGLPVGLQIVGRYQITSILRNWTAKPEGSREIPSCSRSAWHPSPCRESGISRCRELARWYGAGGTAVVSQLTVFDRKGNRTGIAGTPAPVANIGLSPDESRLIAGSAAGSWIVEANGQGRVSINFGTDVRPFWSPDGSRLIFSSGTKLVDRPVSGAGEARELADVGDSHMIPAGISPDGRRILLRGQDRLFLFDLKGKGAPQQVVGQWADNAALSPDGTWVVYRPNAEPGIYAQPVSGASLPRQISVRGTAAVWRADGKEILYYDARGPNISSVRVEGSGDALRFAAPETLFPVARPMGLYSAARPLAVNRDGSRIYFLQSTEQPDSGVIQVRTRALWRGL